MQAEEIPIWSKTIPAGSLGLIGLGKLCVAWDMANAMETILYFINILNRKSPFWQCMLMILSSQEMMREKLQD
jgi:hypothetical protein